MSIRDAQNGLISISVDAQDRLIDALARESDTGQTTTPQELFDILNDAYRYRDAGRRSSHESMGQADIEPPEDARRDVLEQEDARRSANLVSDWMASDEHVDLVGPTITDAGIHEFGRHPVEGPLQEIDWASGATTQR